MYNDNNQSTTKKLSIWLPLLFAIVLVAGMMIGMRMQANAPSLVTSPEELNAMPAGQGKVEELLRYVEAKYVDDIDREVLLQEVIDELLARLDPHSSYISAESLREVNEQLEGNFDGIGVEFMVLDDTVVVIAPLVGGPSEEAGIMAGDKIVEIADSVIAGVKLAASDVIKLMRGEKGSVVKIGVLRDGESKTRHFSITRDEIPMNSVDVAYMLNDKVGYIKVNRFSATTYEEFMRALEDLVEQSGMEDLVLDLRQNPGGYLQQATNMLSQIFRQKDRLLVYTEGRAVNRSDYSSTGRVFFDIEDIVVLIDEGSASASEIVAGAIQDHDRGVIVGRRSFGKGLVQEQYRLRDGSALRLTVARYFTPSGRSIQKPYGDRDAYQQEMLGRYESGELQSADKMLVVDSTAFYTDNGRVVFGGGGISPDVFVPIDTAIVNNSYLQLQQYLPQFIFQYIKTAEAELRAYSMSDFMSSYQVSAALMGEFIAYGKSKGAELDGPLSPAVDRAMRHLLKARLAKYLFESEGFYRVWNQEDAVVREALKAMAKSKSLTASQ